MIFAGIDIGYGYTKVVYNEDKKFIFETTVEPYIPTEKVFGKMPEVININGNGYLVGPEAIPRWQVTKDFVGSESYYAVIGYCLNEIYKQDYNVKGIALGLPPALFNEKKISLLKYNLKQIEFKTTKRYLNIPEQIIFIPQGVGAYIDFITNASKYTNKDVIVIDVGYYTLDMVFIKDGKFISQASESYPSGIELLLQRICSEFVSKHGEFINTKIAETLLQKNSFNFLGKEYKFDTKEVLTKFYIPEIISKIKEYSTFLKNNRFRIDTIEAIVVAGGGAIYLKDMIESVIVSPEPQFANARGYKIYIEQLL